MRQLTLPIVAMALVLAAGKANAAACQKPDGTPMPEPGFSEAAMDSRDWGTELVTFYAGMSDGDRSTLKAIPGKPGAVLMTSRCSPNDLFWTHLSLVGMANPQPGELKAFPEELRTTLRVWGLTERGYQIMPGLLPALEKHSTR